VTKGDEMLHTRRNCCSKVHGACLMGDLTKKKRSHGKENLIESLHVTKHSACFQTRPSESN